MPGGRARHPRRVRRRSAARAAAEGAYEHEHDTKPQAPAFGLADNPVGLASCIVDKYRGWADLRATGGNVLGVFRIEMLLDTLTIYGATETIGSSVRACWEDAHGRPAPTAAARVLVPKAVSVWPHDLGRPPRDWVAREYDLRSHRVHESGGQFPAWEETALHADDLAELARSLP